MAIIWTGSQNWNSSLLQHLPTQQRGAAREMWWHWATTDSCLLHEKQLPARYDAITCTEQEIFLTSDDRNIYQTNYTSCQWEHCCKRITFRILEIVSLPFHKQFFQWGMTLSRPTVHVSCCTTKCTFLCSVKSSILYCFSHTKWSDNFVEIILIIHLLVLKK